MREFELYYPMKDNDILVSGRIANGRVIIDEYHSNDDDCCFMTLATKETYPELFDLITDEIIADIKKIALATYGAA
jgi:hypothetical protein